MKKRPVSGSSETQSHSNNSSNIMINTGWMSYLAFHGLTPLLILRKFSLLDSHFMLWPVGVHGSLLFVYIYQSWHEVRVLCYLPLHVASKRPETCFSCICHFFVFIYLFPCASALKLCNSTNMLCYDGLFWCCVP
jgi:hypothetical protein